MGDIPRAHRRLVPRVAKKDPAPEDLEVTSERVILVDESSDSLDQMPRKMPRGSVDLADSEDSMEMEMTAVRVVIASAGGAPPPVDDYDEMTAQRVIEAVAEEPPVDDFDLGETSTLMKKETLARMLAEKAIPQFDDVAENLAAHDRPPTDANAFSDSEPTALKAHPTSPDAEDRSMAHVSPAERGLLAAMAEGHEASRMVYVKWLEKRGEVVRAEFLRLDCILAQMSPEDTRYLHTRHRLLELAPRISMDWRSRVARSLIEGCTTTTGRCPAYWRALPSEADDARGCSVCGDHVYYCVTIDLARSRIAAGQRVAIDLTVERYHGDLDSARCGSCHNEMPPNTRFCPQCGRMQF